MWSTLPVASFDSWPATRIAALVIDFALLAVAVALWASPRIRYRSSGVAGKASAATAAGASIAAGGGSATAGLASSGRYRLWGFWVCGLDEIRVTDSHLCIDRLRLPLLGSDSGGHRVVVPRRDVRAIEVGRQRLTPSALAAALLASCTLGLWLHYVPCVWWTCDWGDGDAPRVRCAVWYATWPVCFAALCIASRLPAALRIAYEHDGYERELLVAVGGDRRAATAAAALEAVREAMYRVAAAARAGRRQAYVP